ncbi:helix-turn-helix domain-containing protein [Kitasatospora sp. NPDC094016]|uniref:helix-turn-helix domain-containing protein n=1 Tax=Kitasatospora sp. NPDC094016 TaxID=3154986 RepID=UPI003330CA5C
MSLEPMLWALKDSPTADTFERLILVTLAERADSDGCNAFPSQATLAKAALCDEKTVGRKLKQLQQRGLLGEGDQSAARHIPERYRPVVYDLLIPHSWFGHRIDRVNEERRQRGLAPLSARSRPDITPAPARVRRADFGRKRPVDEETAARGDLKSTDSQSPLNPKGAGGTESPGRGDSQSWEGGLQDPQTTPINLPGNPPQGAGGVDVPSPAGAGPGKPDGGDGKPPRPKSKKQQDAERRAAQAEQDQVLDQLARDGATAWWDHAQAQFGPWAGSKNGFMMLMGMIKRAADAGYTKQQIWAALLDCGRHVPSAQQWQGALGTAAGKAAVPGRRAATPMYDDAASHPRAEQPAADSAVDVVLSALDSR